MGQAAHQLLQVPVQAAGRGWGGGGGGRSRIIPSGCSLKPPQPPTLSVQAGGAGFSHPSHMSHGWFSVFVAPSFSRAKPASFPLRSLFSGTKEAIYTVAEAARRQEREAGQGGQRCAPDAFSTIFGSVPWKRCGCLDRSVYEGSQQDHLFKNKPNHREEGGGGRGTVLQTRPPIAGSPAGSRLRTGRQVPIPPRRPDPERRRVGRGATPAGLPWPFGGAGLTGWGAGRPWAPRASVQGRWQRGGGCGWRGRNRAWPGGRGCPLTLKPFPGQETACGSVGTRAVPYLPWLHSGRCVHPAFVCGY